MVATAIPYLRAAISPRGLHSAKELPRLILWGDASQLVGLADADPVSTSTDFSGSGNDATSSLTARPLYKTAIANGLPVLRFDGSNDILTTPSITPSGNPFSMFLVTRPANVAGNYRMMGLFGATLARFFLNTGTGLPAYTIGAASALGAALTTTAFWVLVGTYDGNTRVSLFTNGVRTTNATTASTVSAAVATVGSGSGVFYPGDIAEYGIYDTYVTDDDAARLSRGLMQKWGVQ